ncbi:Uncharacterised protein [Dorea formicigenerans]|uniref:Uncharacterized protein n=1 Tax=Dorea formicigenerans TaxID=39486 RepID=A0A564SG74_9FIRM|nr:Uncharacterised protein [Dorea formicigenerans]
MYQIAHATLYAFRDLFFSHKKLILGALNDAQKKQSDFIAEIDGQLLFQFWKSFRFSFLQADRKRNGKPASRVCYRCRFSRSFFADSSYMLSFSVLCSCVCSRLISPSVSSWHKQDNTLMHQSPGHIQRRTPYNF